MPKRSNKENKKYYARNYMLSLTKTQSLNKLEDILNNDKALASRARYAISAYIYYSKPDINNNIYPSLASELKNYVLSLNDEFKVDKDEDFRNRYKETEGFINNFSNRSEKNNKLSLELKEKISEIINAKKLSINYVSKKTNTDYSNLYKFLKGELNKLSYESAYKVWEELDE